MMPLPPPHAVTRRTVTRRGVLSLLAPSLTTIIACRQAPAVTQAEVSPQQFGATGGDPEADTLGWNRALAHGARTGRPVRARGTYVLRVPAKPAYSWPSLPGASAFVAVSVPGGARIEADRSEIIVGATTRQPAGEEERHFLFGTDRLNVTPGTIADVSFDGLTFDFRDEFGPVHRRTYAIGLTGVDRLTRRNLTIRSTGAQNGRGLLAENIRTRIDQSLTHRNITQGIYTRYERDVTMRDIAFETFVEALDFDGPCWDVTLQRLTFADGSGEAQCIDTGGGSNWLVEDVRATDTGTILDIYIKDTSWPTYAQWVANSSGGTPDCVVPSRMTARRVQAFGQVRGKRMTGDALRIGYPRNRNWLKRISARVASPDRITIEDWRIANGGAVSIFDARNLVMRDLRITDAAPVARSRGAALVVAATDPSTGDTISGTIEGVTIDTDRSMAVDVAAGTDLSLTGLTVRSPMAAQQTLRLSGIAGGLPRVSAVVVNGVSVPPSRLKEFVAPSTPIAPPAGRVRQ